MQYLLSRTAVGPTVFAGREVARSDTVARECVTWSVRYDANKRGPAEDEALDSSRAGASWAGRARAPWAASGCCSQDGGESALEGADVVAHFRSAFAEFLSS